MKEGGKRTVQGGVSRWFRVSQVMGVSGSSLCPDMWDGIRRPTSGSSPVRNPNKSRLRKDRRRVQRILSVGGTSSS